MEPFMIGEDRDTADLFAHVYINCLHGAAGLVIEVRGPAGEAATALDLDQARAFQRWLTDAVGRFKPIGTV